MTVALVYRTALEGYYIGKVHRNSEYNEYRLRVYVGNSRNYIAETFADDLEDARGTIEEMVEQAYEQLEKKAARQAKKRGKATKASVAL